MLTDGTGTSQVMAGLDRAICTGTAVCQDGRVTPRIGRDRFAATPSLP
jgi:hypothetical protein